MARDVSAQLIEKCHVYIEPCYSWCLDWAIPETALWLMVPQAEQHVRFAGFSHLMMNDDECEGLMKFEAQERIQSQDPTRRNRGIHIAWLVAIWWWGRRRYDMIVKLLVPRHALRWTGAIPRPAPRFALHWRHSAICKEQRCGIFVMSYWLRGGQTVF